MTGGLAPPYPSTPVRHRTVGHAGLFLFGEPSLPERGRCPLGKLTQPLGRSAGRSANGRLGVKVLTVVSFLHTVNADDQGGLALSTFVPSSPSPR